MPQLLAYLAPKLLACLALMLGVSVLHAHPATAHEVDGAAVSVSAAADILAAPYISYYVWLVEVHRSARKHGVTDGDIIHAATQYMIAYPLSSENEETPQRELRLGPDRAGNMLEVVVLLLDDGDELIIHAMRMRPKYRELLP